MLAGEVARRREHIVRLQDEIAGLEARMAALDETMQLVDSRVDPAAGGVVRATSSRYHGRGSLTAFIRDQILAAGSKGIDTLTLCSLTMAHFEVPVVSKADVLRFRAVTIKDALIRLTRQGVIERAPRRHGGRTPAVWYPTRDKPLAQLAGLAPHP